MKVCHYCGGSIAEKLSKNADVESNQWMLGVTRGGLPFCDAKCAAKYKDPLDESLDKLRDLGCGNEPGGRMSETKNEIPTRGLGFAGSAEIAQIALEAACVPALLAENSRLNEQIASMRAWRDAESGDRAVLIGRIAELEADSKRLRIFASDLHDIALNGHLDSELLAMRGVAALTAGGSATEADVKEAYCWLDMTAPESAGGE